MENGAIRTYEHVSCSACLKLAAKRGVHIGDQTRMRGGLIGEVAAIVHLRGEIHGLIVSESARESALVPLHALAGRVSCG
jgi:hypothetical protein